MRSRYRSITAIGAAVAALAIATACRKPAEPLKESPKADTSAWQREIQSRRAQVDKVIADNRPSFDAFDSGSLGDATLEMIPFPFLRGSVTYNQMDGGWEWDPAKEGALRGSGETLLALHDPRQTGYAPVGHGSATNPMVMDGQGKSVRIAWSDGAAETRVVSHHSIDVL